MVQEEIQLLLKDLSARLPYSTLCYCKWVKDAPNGTSGCIQEVSTYLLDELTIIDNQDYECQICEIKPYLRPMSSMTEEECDMVEEILGDKCIFDFMSNGDIVLKQGQFSQNKLAKLYDYYNSINVDYRGLIEKGLAIAVTEESNPYKN